MEDTSLPLLFVQRETFWQKVVLVVTESKRREIAMIQLMLELFSPLFNTPEKISEDEKYSQKLKESEKSPEEVRKSIREPFTEQELIRRKWEMRAKSKL